MSAVWSHFLKCFVGKGVCGVLYGLKSDEGEIYGRRAGRYDLGGASQCRTFWTAGIFLGDWFCMIRNRCDGAGWDYWS